MTQEELQRLIQLLSQTQQGIGEERTVERISNDLISCDGKLIEIKKASSEQQGMITDLTEFNLKQFACGHLSAGRSNFGGVCSTIRHNYRKLGLFNRKLNSLTPFVSCNKCLKRCIRCRCLICIYCLRTVPSLPGSVFCPRCAFSRRLGDFFKRR